MTKIESIEDSTKVYYNKIIASKYGVLTSAVFNFLYCKIKSKEKNGKNFLDGEYWNYCTFKQIGCDLGLSKRSIKTQIDKLRTLKLIKAHNYNNIKGYKRLWFAFDDISTIEGCLSKDNIHYAYMGDIKRYKFNQAIMLKTIKYIMEEKGTDYIQITIEKLTSKSGFKNEGFVERSLIRLQKLNKIDISVSESLIISLKSDDIEAKLTEKKVTTFQKKVTRKTEVPKVPKDKNRGRVCENIHKPHENKNPCSFLNEINLILQLDSRLDESFARYAVKKYSFEKVKKHIDYAKTKKINTSFGGYVRNLLNIEARIPNLRNVAFAEEYAFKYDIKVCCQYVKITKNIEIYFDMDHEQFKKEFIEKLASAFKRKVPCFKHNKRLATELKSLNDTCVKEITDYDVTIDVKQGIFKLKYSDLDTEHHLESLINQEVDKLDLAIESMKKQASVFKNHQKIEDLLSAEELEELAL